MSTSGKNRLAIYNLFYNHPLCDYTNNNELNILIIGNGWVGNEAFKAAFWDGQYPGVTLNFTIASNNAKQYESALKEKLPGLCDFADFNGERTSKYHYANINIRTISFEDLSNLDLTEEMLSEDCLDLQKQNVIVISIGDEVANCLLAQILVEHLQDDSQPVLLAVYGSEHIDVPSNVDYVPFSSDVDIDTSELMQLAGNIQYVYSAKYNNLSANRKKEHEYFLTAFEKEFLLTPEDSDDIFVSIENFTGMKYDADSSLAQAVHMPIKLDYCCPRASSERKIAELVKIINERKKKFNTLVALEHRRWNAYMAIRGIRMPKKEELGYLYSNGNNHKDAENRLHICMCECGNDGAKLDKHSPLWSMKKIPNGLSDLDWASLYCHLELSRKLTTINQQLEGNLTTLEKLELSDGETLAKVREYISAVKKLIQDDENALTLYEFAYDKLKQTQQYSDIKEYVADIDKKLKLAKERNKRIDFLSYDVQFISMIPICLKLKDDNSTIITFTNGQVVNDVLVPWILCADKAVFVITQSGFDLDEKKNAIVEFFVSHGNNTKVEFKSIKDLRVESIKSDISALLDSYDNVVFNIVPNMDSTVLLALGEYAEQFSMVSYDSYQGLSFYNLNDILPRRIEDAALNVSDYLRLVQGEIDNQYELLIPYRKCAGFEDFFWKHSDVKSSDGSKKKLYNEWNSIIVTDFLQKKTVEVKGSANCYMLPMSSYKISRAIEFDFLKLLKSERVISEYTISNNNTVSFNTIDDTFYRFLSEKGGNLFEMLVYYKLLHTGIFGDAQTGVSFQWKSGGSDYIKNEIDVVATNGVNLVLVSCKTNPIIDNAFIYEIASEAASFGGIAVLATSQDLSNPFNYNHNTVVRARAMNVALIDQHILRDEQLLKKAANQILTGKYKGPENYR